MLGKMIFVYCHPLMIGFVKAIDFSKIYIENGEATMIALFYEKDLEKFSKSKKWNFLEEKHGIWWRGCEGGAFIEKENYNFEELKKIGLHKFLDYEYSIGTLHNISACISQFSNWERKTPIEFYNSL